MREIARDAFVYIHKHGSSFFANRMSGSLLKQVKQGKDGFESLYDILVFAIVTPIGITI